MSGYTVKRGQLFDPVTGLQVGYIDTKGNEVLGGASTSVASSGPAAYLGQVATRCYPPLTTNSGITRAMSRSHHFARDALVNPTVVFANYRMVNAAEVAGVAGTIDVSLEYPAGTYTRANECIAASNGPVAFAPGNNFFTFNVNVPKGAAFFMRAMQRNASGVLWTQTAGGNTSSYATSPQDFMDLGTSDTIDKVMGGTIGAANGSCFFPIAIISQTTQPSIIIFGTSREAGGSGLSGDTTYDLGPSARIVGRQYGYTTFAQAATFQAQWNAGSHAFLNQLIALGYWTHALNEYGVNDVTADTAATLATRRALMATNLKAQKPDLYLIGHTLYPYVGSSDVFVTKANQTPGTLQPKVTTFNNLVRAGIAGENAFWDMADGLDPFREGKYPVSRNPSDTSRTPASLTAGISGTTMTITATASGTLAVGDMLYDAGGLICESTWITDLGSYNGATGPVTVSKPHSGFPYKAAVPTGTTITTAGYTTKDGLHATWWGEEMIIRNRGADLLSLIRR